MELSRGHDKRRASGRLAVRTSPVADQGDLLSQLPHPSALAWVRQGEGLVGWGEAARLTLPPGPDRFTAAEEWLRGLAARADVEDPLGLPGTGLVAFGSFTFDAASGGSVLVVPSIVLGRRAGRAWVTTIGAEGRDSALASAAAEASPSEIRWHDGSLPAPDWQRAVGAAVGRIRAGGLGKVVLARDLFATASADIDIRVLLRRLADRYPECYTFSCGGLVGATPELLIRRQDSDISSLVLAGTTPRGRDEAEDEALGSALLSSAKDAEEHEYAVASVRGTLAPLCEHLEVDDRPFLLRLANVQHLATAVTGKLGWGPDGPRHSALSLVSHLHPTGAVCGTPTQSALDLIHELEGMDRGRYAGPVGWTDAEGNGEWGIALRCAQIDGPRARLFAGCGIVAGSDPAAELAEAQAKFRPMQFAVEGDWSGPGTGAR